MYPDIRMRRVRRTEGLRALAQETNLSPDDLIQPLFAMSGDAIEEEIPSLPGVHRYSTDLLRERVEELAVPAVLLFGVPDGTQKNERGSAALDPDGIVPEAVRMIKDVRPDLLVITDVCLCAYTTHGHCGMVTEDGEINNDETIPLIARMAEVHAEAGADVVAPSGMMDGQVAGIRDHLDSSGLKSITVMSYAAKFASSFYGPFRDVAHSSPSFGDRQSYQLPCANRREGVRDALLDEREGADWLMVKPAMPYLDVLQELRQETRLPLAAYQVSGEYAMIKSAAEKGRIDEKQVMHESLLSIKRAGADAIITYFADEMANTL